MLIGAEVNCVNEVLHQFVWLSHITNSLRHELHKMQVVFRVFEHQLAILYVERVHTQVENTPVQSKATVNFKLAKPHVPPIMCVFHLSHNCMLRSLEDLSVVQYLRRYRWVPHNLEHLVSILLIVAWVDVDEDDLGTPQSVLVLPPEHVQARVLLQVLE